MCMFTHMNTHRETHTKFPDTWEPRQNISYTDKAMTMSLSLLPLLSPFVPFLNV